MIQKNCFRKWSKIIKNKIQIFREIFLLNQIILQVAEKFQSLESVEAVASDGCVTNTGHSNGMIRNFELQINKPVQWIICALHLAELLFKNVFIKIDGKLDGPESYSGAIGKQISGVNKSGLNRSPMVKFKARHGSVPTLQDDNNLLHNNDISLFYYISHLVMAGPNSKFKHHFNKKPGKVHGARYRLAPLFLNFFILKTLR